MKYDPVELVEKTSIISLESTKELNDLNLNFLFNYDIFPKKILIGLTQWRAENRKMVVGGTIAQQVFIFSIPYQTYCTKAALNHVKASIEAQLK